MNSKKVLAVRKEQKRKQGKQRTIGSTIDYSPLPIDKHEPEFVSIPCAEFHVVFCGVKKPHEKSGHQGIYFKDVFFEIYVYVYLNIQLVVVWLIILCCISLKGPCRRKLDGIIQGMKDTSRVMALSLYLPNCDRKGFFKRKQVSLHSLNLI